MEAKITGILVTDPLLGPEVAKMPGCVHNRPVEGGVAYYFHENPAQSQLPIGKELRRLLDDVKLEQYPAEEKPKAKASGVKGPTKKEE